MVFTVLYGAGERKRFRQEVFVALAAELWFLGSRLVGFFRGVGVVHVLVIGTTINISTRVLLAGVMTRRYGLAGLAAATGIGWEWWDTSAGIGQS